MSFLWALVFVHVYELLLVAARKHLNGSNIAKVERFRGYSSFQFPQNKLPNQFFKILNFLCEMLRNGLYNETVFICMVTS